MDRERVNHPDVAVRSTPIKIDVENTNRILCHA